MALNDIVTLKMGIKQLHSSNSTLLNQTASIISCTFSAIIESPVSDIVVSVSDGEASAVHKEDTVKSGGQNPSCQVSTTIPSISVDSWEPE